MLKTSEVNEVLRKLIQAAGKRRRGFAARIDRLQSMVVALGHDLGLPTDSLSRWRVALVHTECGQVLDDVAMTESGIDSAWMTLDEQENHLFQQACMIAESWNAAWENRGAIAAEVERDCGHVVDGRAMEAFQRLHEVIQPIRQ